MGIDRIALTVHVVESTEVVRIVGHLRGGLFRVHRLRVRVRTCEMRGRANKRDGELNRHTVPEGARDVLATPPRVFVLVNIVLSVQHLLGGFHTNSGGDHVRIWRTRIGHCPERLDEVDDRTDRGRCRRHKRVHLVVGEPLRVLLTFGVAPLQEFCLQLCYALGRLLQEERKRDAVVARGAAEVEVTLRLRVPPLLDFLGQLGRARREGEGEHEEGRPHRGRTESSPARGGMVLLYDKDLEKD